MGGHPGGGRRSATQAGVPYLTDHPGGGRISIAENEFVLRTANFYYGELICTPDTVVTHPLDNPDTVVTHPP